MIYNVNLQIHYNIPHNHFQVKIYNNLFPSQIQKTQILFVQLNEMTCFLNDIGTHLSIVINVTHFPK